MKVLYFETLPSTNEYLKKVHFEPFLAVVALSQSSGRGRRGRRWLSEKGKGLYFSILLPPLKRNLTLAGLAFGYGVFKVLRELSPHFYLKWPNDIYIRGRKVAGVLPELLKDRLIVGVGINLLYKENELKLIENPATSLFIEGIDFDYFKLVSSLHRELTSTYKALEGGDFDVKWFEKACPLIGSQVKVIEGEKVYNALALGIDKEGALIVETGSGIRRLFSADVSVREVV